jgi:glucose-1-phosphate cytidylyltransferase
MKAVILAGGLGTRMREETEFKPKPMVEIGGRPTLWHIMKILSGHGITDFVIAAGYKKEQIKQYFLNYEAMSRDFTVDLGSEGKVTFHDSSESESWTVSVVDTGAETMTGGRLLRLKEFLKDDIFMCTYGDGIADVDVTALLEFARTSGTVATLAAAQPASRFGVLEVATTGRVTSFREKPQVTDWVNIGFFVFSPDIFSYLMDGDSTVLENEPLHQLVQEGQLSAFKHHGFWQPMDTYRESQILNDLWSSGRAPWATWLATSGLSEKSQHSS